MQQCKLGILLGDLYGAGYGAKDLKRALKLLQETVDNGVQTGSSRVKVVHEFWQKPNQAVWPNHKICRYDIGGVCFRRKGPCPMIF